MKFIVRGFLIIVFGIGLAYANSDSRAGYQDGCSSARGHYTRSNYKYRHSWVYKRSWRKGKRVCRRGKIIRRNYKSRATVCMMRHKTSWVIFKRGYEQGYRAGLRLRHKFIRVSGCLEYRRGWVAGYRSSSCPQSIN